MALNFKEFVELTKQNVAELLPTHKVEVKEITKNNAVTKTALLAKVNGSNICPTIYMEPYYELYTAEFFPMSTDDIAKDIVEKIKENNKIKNYDLDWLSDFDKVKDKIYMTLVNGKQNEDMLLTHPMKRFHDLVLLFRVQVNVNGAIGSTIVSNNLMELWGIDLNELYETAKENTPKLFPIKTLSMGEMNLPFFSISEIPREEQLHIITNTNTAYGVAAILYDDYKVLQDYANEFDSDLYILPSSVHEVLVASTKFVDRNFAPDPVTELKNMVGAVNSNEVEADELLSNEVYRYLRATNEIEII